MAQRRLWQDHKGILIATSVAQIYKSKSGSRISGIDQSQLLFCCSFCFYFGQCTIFWYWSQVGSVIGKHLTANIWWIEHKTIKSTHNSLVPPSCESIYFFDFIWVFKKLQYTIIESFGIGHSVGSTEHIWCWQCKPCLKITLSSGRGQNIKEHTCVAAYAIEASVTWSFHLYEHFQTWWLLSLFPLSLEM